MSWPSELLSSKVSEDVQVDDDADLDDNDDDDDDDRVSIFLSQTDTVDRFQNPAALGYRPE